MSDGMPSGNIAFKAQNIELSTIYSNKTFANESSLFRNTASFYVKHIYVI